jgi:CRP-like cAMP-binding protein
MTNTNNTKKMKKDLVKEFSATWGNLIEESTVLTFQPEQVIFYENHFPCGVYIVTSGVVELVTQNKDEQRLVAPMHSPLGIDFISDGHPYPFTAVAKTNVTTLFVYKSTLQTLFAEGTKLPNNGEGKA